MAGISYRDWVSSSLLHSEFTIENDASSGTPVTDIGHITTPRLRERFRVSSNQLIVNLEFNADNDGLNPITGRNAMSVGCVYVGGVGTDSSGDILSNITVKLYNAAGTEVASEFTAFSALSDPYSQQGGYLILFPDSGGSNASPIEHSDITRVKVGIQTAGTYVEAGRIWVGNFHELSFDSGWSISSVSNSKTNFTPYLDAHPIFSSRRKKGSFPLSMISHDDALGVVDGLDEDDKVNSLMDASLECGKDKEMVCIYRHKFDSPKPNRQFIYGLLDKDMKISHMGGNNFETQIDIIELI